MSTPAQTKAHNALNTYLAASRGQSILPERQRRARIAFLEAIETIVTEEVAAATANTRAALARTDRDKIAAIADHMHALDELAAAKTSANGWADRVAVLNAELTEARTDRDDYAARLKAPDASWAQLAAERDQLREQVADLQGQAAMARDTIQPQEVPVSPVTAAVTKATTQATERARTAAKPRKPRNPTPTKGATGEAGKTAQSDA